MSKPPSCAADVAGAIEAIRKAKAIGRGRRSPVYLWFWKRHDALAAAFEENAPSWPALAEYLGNHGVLDGHGKPPSAGATENAWWRVKRDKARDAGAKAATGEVMPQTPAKPVPADDLPDDDADWLQTMGGPREWKPKKGDEK